MAALREGLNLQSDLKTAAALKQFIRARQDDLELSFLILRGYVLELFKNFHNS